MVSKKELEEMAQDFDTSKDFDAVMAYFDVQELKLIGKTVLELGTSAGTVTKYLLPISDRLDIVEGSITGIERTKKMVYDPENKINYYH